MSSDRDAVAAFPEQVVAEHDRVDVLVNNAGVALAGTFEQVSEADFEWLFGINFWGVVRMTRAFLPLLQKQGRGAYRQHFEHIWNDRPAGQDGLFGEQIRRPRLFGIPAPRASETSIGVTVVHPGGVATSIVRRMPGCRRPIPAEEDDAKRKSSKPFSPCRLKSPAKLSSAASKTAKRASWSVPMLRCWH